MAGAHRHQYVGEMLHHDVVEEGGRGGVEKVRVIHRDTGAFAGRQHRPGGAQLIGDAPRRTAEQCDEGSGGYRLRCGGACEHVS